MKALREHPRAAVLGYVAWDPAIKITPFMRHLTRQAYGLGARHGGRMANFADPQIHLRLEFIQIAKKIRAHGKKDLTRIGGAF